MVGGMARGNGARKPGHRTRFPRCFGTMSREKVMKHPSRRVHPGLPELKQHYLFRGRTGKRDPSRTTILFSGAIPDSSSGFIAEGRAAGNYENLATRRRRILRVAPLLLKNLSAPCVSSRARPESAIINFLILLPAQRCNLLLQF